MKRLPIMLLLAAVVMAGCSKPKDEAMYVRIAPSILTRVSALRFDAGDRIGLTVVRGSETWADNRLMTYDGAAFAAPGFIWYDQRDEPSTLTAYHPYSEAGLPEEFTVETDQRSGCAPSDLLGACRTDVMPGTTPVAMLFHHLMSQLTLVVTNTSSSRVTGITLGGFVPTAEVDFAALTAAARAGVPAADIRTCCVTENASYRAVLVPQRGSLTVRVATDDGRERTETLEDVALESGWRYDMAVKVTEDDIALTISAEIEDWQDGGLLGGGSGGEEVLTYAGENYRTVTVGGRVWMAENLRYLPQEAAIGTGVWYPEGGEKVAARQGLLYDHALAVGEAPSANAPVQGICPAGWHVPDRDELAALAEAQRVDGFFCCAGIWLADSGRYGSSSKGYLMGATLQNGKFDCLSYTDTAGGEPQLATQTRGGCGVSLRCVRD